MLKIKNITKRFPGVLANDRINLEIEGGEIHGLLGENGAGKTTLMNIIYGLVKPDEGEIYLDSKMVEINSPKDAISLGIGMIHQHFMLIPTLTVAENVVLGIEPTRGIFFDKEKAIDVVSKISQKYSLKVNAKALIQDISVGIEQRVEILKALYRGAEILILDEPTAVLTPQEVLELFKIMKSLKEQNKTIIFITHKLKEPLAICDRITVLRRGRVVGTVLRGKTNMRELARMMVGREVILEVEKKEIKKGKRILKVENLRAKDRGVDVLKGISFELYEGEILGIAGVEGNGQKELAEVLTGLRKVYEGRTEFLGKDVTNKPSRYLRGRGLCYIPEDRTRIGLILEFDVTENLVLGSHFKKPFSNGFSFDYEVAKRYAHELISKFDIRTPSENTVTKYLSGGNLQKVVVAREFSRNPKLIIASQPTRGLDVGAIEYIHKRILDMRNSGKAVLLISADLDEILKLSDRIAVIYEGEIVSYVSPKISEEEIGLLMAGQVVS